jgi:hypothetical protein
MTSIILTEVSENITATLTEGSENITVEFTEGATGARSDASITIGTANGLTLSGTALSLGLSSASAAGALSAADWSSFNGKVSFPGFGTTGTTACAGNDARVVAGGTALQSLTGALLATGATTGATSQAQAFTLGLAIPPITQQLDIKQATSGPGTIEVQAGTPTIVRGTSTLFTKTFRVGDNITIGAVTKAITVITSDTQLTTATWGGAIAAGTVYVITARTGPSIFGNGSLIGVAGTLAQPSITVGEPHTGLYQNASARLAVVANGTLVMSFYASGAFVGAGIAIGIGSIWLKQKSTGILGFYDGAAASNLYSIECLNGTFGGTLGVTGAATVTGLMTVAGNISGSAGNLTITAGIGNNRALYMQATGSAGAANTAIEVSSLATPTTTGVSAKITGVYGGMYMHDNVATQAATIAYGLTAGWNTAQGFNGPSNDMTPDKVNSRIAAPVAGTYLVNYSASFYSPTDTAEVTTVIFYGAAGSEVEAAATECASTIPAGDTDHASTSGTGFIALTAGQIVQLRLKASASITVTLNNANITLVRVGS